jgi:integrase
LRSALEVQRRYTDDVELARGVRVQAVFHRAGRPVRDFRDAWRTALATAGLPTTTHVHDFRRTAARNLLRAGVPQAVAMSLMGHQTDAMFRRYAIVDEELLSQAGQRLQDLLSSEPSEPSARRVVPIKPPRRGV